MANLLLETLPVTAPGHMVDEHTSIQQTGFLASRHLALVVEYQGTHYCGFQLQENQPTVQGELEQALLRLTGATVRVRGASRTDSGAHAKGQVVDFLTCSPLSTAVFLKGLNYHLPADIRVHGSYEVDAWFHSRKSALGRTYRYTFHNSPTPSPLIREFSHWVRDPLDVDAMDTAAQELVGVHDFKSLSRSLPPGRSATREVRRWECWAEGELVFMEAEANGFLPHQIRRTGAVLLEVGLARLEPDILPTILNGEAQAPAWCAVLPAKGLCLMSVNYSDFPPENRGS